MAITVEIYEEIRQCREKYGYGQRKTARLLKVSRNTVKKYWDGSTVPWERKQGSGRKNDVLTDGHLKFIDECLEEDKQAPKKQRHTAHRIFTRLCEEKGYTGCESAVRAAVAERRKRITNCFVPLAYEPGESMQIDWGETTVFLKGVKTKVNIWCMRECYSADIFVMAFMRQNEESFLEGILNGFEYFGGVPRKLIFDNAKVAVKDGFGANAVATDKYKAMAAHYAFTPVFCNVAQGHEKGLVEGLVGFSRRNFFAPLPRYENLDELNAYLREKCIGYRKTKIPGKPMSVGEMAKVALQSYIPLPSYRFDTSKTVEHKADSFALVKFDGNKYSVPYQYSNKTVTVKGYGDKVVFMFRGEIIAQYDRDYRHDETNFKLEHYIDLIERKPRSVYDAAPVKKTLPKPFYEFILKLKNPKEVVRIIRCYLNNPDAAMSAISAANYEEFMLKFDLNVGKEKSANALCKRVEQNNIPVNSPHLERYDNLLRREVI